MSGGENSSPDHSIVSLPAHVDWSPRRAYDAAPSESDVLAVVSRPEEVRSSIRRALYVGASWSSLRMVPQGRESCVQIVYSEAKRRFWMPPEREAPGGRTGSAAPRLFSRPSGASWGALGCAENIGIGITVGLLKSRDGVQVRGSASGGVGLLGAAGAVGVGEPDSGPGTGGGSCGPPCWTMKNMGLGSMDAGLTPILTVELAVSLKKYVPLPPAHCATSKGSSEEFSWNEPVRTPVYVMKSPGGTLGNPRGI